MKNRILLLAFAVLLFAACQQSRESESRLILQITDAPADYDSVLVEVVAVALHTAGSGWMTADVPDKVYDLLLLQNNATAVLDTTTLPAGKLTQFRLILGSDNRVVVDGTSHPLQLSSQDETGLKRTVNYDVVGGQTHTLVIDFDASVSIIEEGNGDYRLKPVISASFY